jgi:hypothetical protein
VFRPEASALKGLTSAYGQPEAGLPHSFNMSVSFAFESQDFCCAENLIFLAVTSAFRLDNLVMKNNCLSSFFFVFHCTT